MVDNYITLKRVAHCICALRVEAPWYWPPELICKQDPAEVEKKKKKRTDKNKLKKKLTINDAEEIYGHSCVFFFFCWQVITWDENFHLASNESDKRRAPH